MHADAPLLSLYEPAGQGVPVTDTAPTPQYDPGTALQSPLHDGSVNPDVEPYVPAGHSEHTHADAVLLAKEPGGQARHVVDAAADVAPAEHTVPDDALATHVDTPEHSDDDSPGTAP